MFDLTVTRIQLAVVIGLVLGGCDIPNPRPYQSLSVGSGPSAVIRTTAVPGGDDAFHVVQVEIFGYDHGCPDPNLKRASSGYKGYVILGSSAHEFTVPAGRRIVLSGGWSNNFGRCRAVVSFKPDSGAIYQYEYSEPGGPHCEAAVAQIVPGPSANGTSTFKKIDSLVGVRPKRTWSGDSFDELCALPP